jgi:hypothetical protein
VGNNYAYPYRLHNYDSLTGMSPANSSLWTFWAVVGLGIYLCLMFVMRMAGLFLRRVKGEHGRLGTTGATLRSIPNAVEHPTPHTGLTRVVHVNDPLAPSYIMCYRPFATWDPVETG